MGGLIRSLWAVPLLRPALIYAGFFVLAALYVLNRERKHLRSRGWPPDRQAVSRLVREAAFLALMGLFWLYMFLIANFGG